LDEIESEVLKNGPLDASSKLSQLASYYSNPNNDKLQKLQNQIDNVTDVQSENVNKVLNNQVKFSSLVLGTEDMNDQAEHFKRTTRKQAKCCEIM